MALGSTQPLTEMSTRDFSRGNGGWCVWLTTYHPYSAEISRKSGALTYPEPLGPPWPVSRHIYLTLYDSVPLNKLWETLDKSTINTRLIEAIQSLYKGASSKIKIGNLITKGFKFTKGLRQGCSLLPTIFNIYLE